MVVSGSAGAVRVRRSVGWRRVGLPWLLRLALAGATLPMCSAAYAELWVHVDERGITHVAATQVDERYQLFYKGSELAGFNLLEEESARLNRKAPAVGGGDAGEPRFVLPKRFARLDASPDYQAVRSHLRAAAKAHQVDYELLKAVVAAESGFDAEAVSPKGAVGLMQLLPSTARQYGVAADQAGRRDRRGQVLPARSVEQKLTDPQTNIQAGARYLAYLIRLFKGELELALAAYNAGEGAVQRAGNKIPDFRETQGYVKTVMGLYAVFKPAQTAGGRAATGAPPAVPMGARAGNRVRVEFDRTSANLHGGE